jgi:hypothetical protein
MIYARFTTPMRDGIFQYHGPRLGELFPACGSDRYLPDFCAILSDFTTGNHVAFMPITAFFDHSMPGFRQQQSFVLEKLQTQNA